VRRAGLLNIYGLQGTSNSTGDDQKKLDVIANGDAPVPRGLAGVTDPQLCVATPAHLCWHVDVPPRPLSFARADIWINSLKHTNLVGVMVSEENEDPIVFPDLKDAKYAVAFDPLDGSSLIDCNGSIGSIWSIFRRRNAGGEPPSAADVLRQGSEMVCAGYVMYGSSTEMVLTFGEGAYDGHGGGGRQVWGRGGGS
jgi:fructose-1,6-bisphosphatase I